MTEFKKFNVEHNGVSYNSEFDFDAMKKADEMEVTKLTGSPMAFTFTIFFCSISKNHPFVTMKKAREFFDSVIRDDDYGIAAFEEISEEFSTHFLELSAQKGKKKKFFAQEPTGKVLNIPKAEQ